MWLEAEEKIAASQSYRIGDRTLYRANLKEVREQIKYWAAQVEQAGRKGRNRMYRAVLRDN